MTDVVACPHCGTKNRVPADARGHPRCGRCRAALPWLTHADDSSFVAVVERSPLPVLLDLWAPWCGPCRIVEPGVERAARTFAGRLKAVKVNVDDAPGVAHRFNARSIPLLLVLEGGLKRAEQVGAVGPDQLIRWLEPHLAG